LAETVFPVSVKNTFPNHFIMPECAKAHLQSRISCFFLREDIWTPAFQGEGKGRSGNRWNEEGKRKEKEGLGDGGGKGFTTTPLNSTHY